MIGSNVWGSFTSLVKVEPDGLISGFTGNFAPCKDTAQCEEVQRPFTGRKVR